MLEKHAFSTISALYGHTRQPQIVEERQRIPLNVGLVDQAGALVEDQEVGAVVGDRVSLLEGP